MKKIKVKQIIQQLLIAVVVFSLICPGSLWAQKEKAGAKVIVTKTDGQQVKGELLQVEENSLLLLIHESLAKVSISIDEIDNIQVKKKSKARKGAKIMGPVLGTAGCILGGRVGHLLGSDDETSYGGAMIGGIAIGCVIGIAAGLLLGTFTFGMASSGYKTYRVKGKAPDEIKYILWKLKKKARFKN